VCICARLASEYRRRNVNDEFTPRSRQARATRRAINDRGALGQRSAGAALHAGDEPGARRVGPRRRFGASLDGAFGRRTRRTQMRRSPADRGTVGLAILPGAYRSARATTTAASIHRSVRAAAETGRLRSPAATTSRASSCATARPAPALDGDHSFRRFNPALGVNWNPRPALTWFASVTQGMRVPAPAELTCADATAPVRCAEPVSSADPASSR